MHQNAHFWKNCIPQLQPTYLSLGFLSNQKNPVMSLVPSCSQHSGQNMGCQSRPTVYTSTPISPDWFIVSSLRGNNTQILPHFQLQNSVVVLRSRTEIKLNASAQLQSTNLLLSNGIKIISIFKRLNGDLAFTNFTIQKSDRLKKTTTNRTFSHQVA